MQYCFPRNASRAAWALPLLALLCGALLALGSLSVYAVPTIDEPAPALKGALFDGTPFDLSGRPLPPPSQVETMLARHFCLNRSSSPPRPPDCF